jgi:DNA modification methylase
MERQAIGPGESDQSTVWEIDHRKSDTGHGTQKPIECMKRPIENNSRVGDYVYDPFVGSGTTLIAAEMTGRKALVIEIDRAYCEVVIRRWEIFVGNRKATLDGKTLEQVAAARRKGKGNGVTKPRGASVRANRKGDGLRPAGVDAAADAGGDAPR